MTTATTKPTKQKPSRRTNRASIPEEARSVTPPSATGAHRATFMDPERRTAMISEAAYYFAESRGFEPGHELDDWLAAQEQIDAALAIGVL